MKSNTLTIGQKIEEITSEFERAELYFGHGTETAWDEAAWLLAHVLGISTQTGQLDADIPISAKQTSQIQALVERRTRSRAPLAYLINSAWFCGLEFFVDERVIVPRSPIAELIANDFSPWSTKVPGRILDLCTGSGCIAVACAIQFPESTVVATDISENALEVARINVERHVPGGRVSLCQADVFEGLPQQQFDIIVCNPPYVDAEDMSILPKEYRHEPELALVAGADGLDIVRRLLRRAGNFLASDGLLVCEVGNSAEALSEAYPRVPFTWIEFEYGGHGVFLLTANDLQALQ